MHITVDILQIQYTMTKSLSNHCFALLLTKVKLTDPSRRLIGR